MGTLVRTAFLILKKAIVQKHLSLSKYCIDNRLKMNCDKTHWMLIKSNQRRRGADGEELELGEEVVEESVTERVLGLLVNRAFLNWAPQLTKVLTECEKKLGGLKKGGKFFSFKQRLETGKAVSLSKLFYAVECWGPGLNLSQTRSLHASQNKLLRWITGDRYRMRWTVDLHK